MTKRILCYGDSNTWGAIPGGDETTRYTENVRWTGVLQSVLGNDYRIIEEGYCGRTTVFDDVVENRVNGLTYFAQCIASQSPLDLIIIMLGTNDLKFSHTPEYVAKSMEVLLEMAYNPYSWERQKCPRVLLIAPPKLSENIRSSCFCGMFTEESVQISGRIGKLYKKLAEKWECDFLDAAEFVKASPVDCVHLEREGHKILAKAVAEKIKAMFRR